MNGGADIRSLLSDWPYDPESNLRIAQGADGREILQVRLPLGVEQYELNGRPDGRRSHDSETTLDFHLERLQQARVAGNEDTFQLSPTECAELFAEGTLFYFRYLHLFQLGDWKRTLRDTARNVKLFDFVRRYAAREEDRQNLEKWRPYLLRMNAVAQTMIEIDGRNHGRALEVVNEAIRKIEALPEMADETFQLERQRSLSALRELAAYVKRARPLSEVERLEKDLRKAVAAQEFERAAELRDRIRDLRKQEPTQESLESSRHA